MAQDSTDVRSQLKWQPRGIDAAQTKAPKTDGTIWRKPTMHALELTVDIPGQFCAQHADLKASQMCCACVLCSLSAFRNELSRLRYSVDMYFFSPHAFVLQHTGLGESTGFLLVDINLVTTKTTCFLNKNDSGDPNKLSKTMVAESTKRNHGYVQNHRLSRVLMPPQVNLNKYYAIDCFCLVSIFAACFVVSDPNVQPMQFPGIQSVARTPLTS